MLKIYELEATVPLKFTEKPTHTSYTVQQVLLIRRCVVTLVNA